MAAVVALSEEIGLRGGHGVVYTCSLPWIIGEVRVEDVGCMRHAATVDFIDLM